MNSDLRVGVGDDLDAIPGEDIESKAAATQLAHDPDIRTTRSNWAVMPVDRRPLWVAMAVLVAGIAVGIVRARTRP